MPNSKLIRENLKKIKIIYALNEIRKKSEFHQAHNNNLLFDISLEN